MVKLRDVECTINTVDGPLVEYMDPDNSDDALLNGAPVKSVYVESQEGIPFSINVLVPAGIQLLPEADGIVFLPSFDGGPVHQGWIAFSGTRCNAEGINIQNTYGKWEVQKFTFSKITIFEDPRPDGHADTHRLGEVVVTLRRYLTDGTKYALDKAGAELSGVKEVHEKALKGRDIAHSVGLGDKTPRAYPPTRCNGKYIDSTKKPWATFVFKYRCKRALKGLGLIPRTPSPSPSPSENVHTDNTEIEAMSPEQLKAEVLRLRRERADVSKVIIKSENAPSGVKRERESTFGPEAAIGARKKKPRVIDLTEDS